MKTFFTFCLAATLSLSAIASAKPRGRFDIGPTYLNIKVQENGKTQKNLYMQGFRADSTIVPNDNYGVAFKPFVQLASGGGTLVGTGLGVGHGFPLGTKWKILPLVGYSYNRLSTHVDLPLYGFFHQKEKFFSNSYYVGGDIAYTICEKWSVTACYQYAWAKTRTKIGDLVRTKGSSSGSTFSGILDYYLNDNWGITFAVAYNNSLSKEKHGIEAFGGRIGIAYFY